MKQGDVGSEGHYIVQFVVGREIMKAKDGWSRVARAARRFIKKVWESAWCQPASQIRQPASKSKSLWQQAHTVAVEIEFSKEVACDIYVVLF